VLECRCGEKLILLGRKSDWRKEGRTVFECGGCKEELFLDDTSRRRVRV
jgi:predicted SprT family Zn-dependent metalloprotease